VHAAATVEDLDVLEDGAPRRGPGRPHAAVEELLFQRREEALATALSQHCPGRDRLAFRS